jgi:hypothetical protein
VVECGRCGEHLKLGQAACPACDHRARTFIHEGDAPPRPAERLKLRGRRGRRRGGVETDVKLIPTSIFTPISSAWRNAARGGVFAAMGAVIAVTSPVGAFDWVVALLVGIMGAVAAGVGLYRAYGGRPVLVLDQGGFTFAGRWRVPWHEVAAVRVGKVFRVRAVLIQVGQPEVTFRLNRGWKRVMGRFSRQLSGGDLMIVASLLPMEPEELARLLGEWTRACGE